MNINTIISHIEFLGFEKGPNMCWQIKGIYNSSISLSEKIYFYADGETYGGRILDNVDFVYLITLIDMCLRKSMCSVELFDRYSKNKKQLMTLVDRDKKMSDLLEPI